MEEFPTLPSNTTLKNAHIEKAATPSPSEEPACSDWEVDDSQREQETKENSPQLTMEWNCNVQAVVASKPTQSNSFQIGEGDKCQQGNSRNSHPTTSSTGASLIVKNIS